MRANCELTLPRGRQIIISGIGLGLRFFYLMNFFKQSDPPQPAIRFKSPPGTQRQLGGGDLNLIAGWTRFCGCVRMRIVNFSIPPMHHFGLRNGFLKF